MNTTIKDIISKGHETSKAASVTISAEALENIAPGTIIAQQGDIYLSKLDKVPPDTRPWPFLHGQLAPGTTQGSRHTVDLAQVRLWLLSASTALDGPIIEAPDGCVISHPEHGAHCYPPGIYHVTFQRAYADRLRRVTD